jgi:hypothetical protein
VLELRNEIQRVNDALKNAHETILALRRENRELEAQVEGEKTRAQIVVQAIGEQMERAQEMRRGFLNGDVSVQGPKRERRGASLPPMSTFGSTFGPMEGGSGVDASSITDPKTRRRYESGMGFLEEEGEAVLGDGELL